MVVNNETLVCGCQIQVDPSGVGHAWQAIARDDIHDVAVLEIEGEIIDGGVDACECYVASNGIHYRW